ncbi:MAG: DNA gyrase inhibitor YacG [Terriglobales bacterium]
MPQKRLIKLGCPICRKPVTSADPDFPFCSDRCRLIDLGKWATGAYIIPSPFTDMDEEIAGAEEGAAEDPDESK